MSTNLNRAKLNKAKNGKEYHIILMHDEWSYCYICSRRCGNFYYSCHPSDLRAYRHGNGRPIYSHNYRSYKTWKYNRKKQWK